MDFRFFGNRDFSTGFDSFESWRPTLGFCQAGFSDMEYVTTVLFLIKFCSQQFCSVYYLLNKRYSFTAGFCVGLEPKDRVSCMWIAVRQNVAPLYLILYITMEPFCRLSMSTCSKLLSLDYISTLDDVFIRDGGPLVFFFQVAKF